MCETIQVFPDGSEGTSSSNACVEGVTTLTSVTATSCELQCRPGYEHTHGNAYFTCYASGGVAMTDFQCTERNCVNFNCSDIYCNVFDITSIQGAIGLTCPSGEVRLTANTSCK